MYTLNINGISFILDIVKSFTGKKRKSRTNTTPFLD